MRNRAEEIVPADIVDLSHDGRGVSELSGKTVFVPGALPGERVLLKTRKHRRRYQEAELVEIVEPSRNRVVPPCEYFGRCGGCALQHLGYRSQIEFKERVVAEAFKRIGAVEPPGFSSPITGSQWHYRRRARLGIKFVEGKGRVLVGFRERSAPYLTDMLSCRILVPPMDSLPAALADVLAGSELKRRIPQAEIAMGDEFGAVVLRVLDPPAEKDLAAFAKLASELDVDIYLQTGGPDSVAPLNDSPRQLAYSLPDEGVRLNFEPGDFIQVNAEINQAMVRTALELAELTSSDSVLDLYCGIGNFSLPIARHVGSVTGVEGQAALVARANANAKLNGIDNVEFLTADLDQAHWPFFSERCDVVFLDPARAGAEAAVAAMSKVSPRRLVYVSCHPGTLARDAGELVKRQGFSLSSLRVLDMFPNTHHVEVIAVFDRNV